MPGVYVLHSRGRVVPARRASGDRSSLLDKRTLTGQKRQSSDLEWVLCTTALPDVGVVETGWSKLDCGSGFHGVKGKGRNQEDNRKRAARRARRRVRVGCLAIRARFILTLTYHENMTDRDVALYHRQEFDRLMKERYRWWTYVAVLEAQKRGALHWHIAIPEQVNVEYALWAWRKVTGDPTITEVHMGFRPLGRGNAFAKCAHYCSKYIGKEMSERDEEQHRYHIGRGVMPPVQRHYLRKGGMHPLYVACEIAGAVLGTGLEMWSAPMPEGASYGFMQAQVAELQEGVWKGTG